VDISSARYSHCHVKLALALAAAFMALVSCSADPARGNAIDKLAIPSAHDLLPVAYEAARGWRADAHLIFIHLYVHPDLAATFSFNSPSDPRAGLNVHIRDPLGRPDLRLAEVSSPGRGEARFSVDSYASGGIDSTQAFAIALEAGGRSFLETHPEAWGDAWEWNVNLQYVRAPAGELPAWRVYFTDLESEGFEVLIDPHTGEVLATIEGP